MMVSSRKRGRQEMEAVEPPLKERSLTEQIRNMWEFANLAQWIFVFGRAVKIDENLDIEELEIECLKSNSTVLPEIGLALLKFVSSHRGLTPEIFDEYTRRQYVAKAPQRNPFGVDEEPLKFREFDIFTKIRVLQQLTQWTMGNPDRIRERMEEQKDIDQTIWRIEPFGWDADDRTYILLDDNRLYRRTDPPLPPLPAPKSKKNSKKARASLRASKRRKVSEPFESEPELAGEGDVDSASNEKEDDGFGGMLWECIAVTLDEVNAFIASIEKSRDPNEKILRKRMADDVLPLLEKQEESRKRKALQKERELLNLEKLATAKRSSRIAGKVEQQKIDEEARESERKKHAELVMAKKEQEKWLKLEKERESRMMTREQRLKEREARRILHEEELANLSEDSKKIGSGEARLSERHLKAEIERKKQALEELAEEEDWIFDCICGAYGPIDDGTHSIACDKCNIWQHSKCVGVSQAEAERDDFHFICKTCVRRAQDAERAKTHPPIKIKLNRPGSSSSSTAPNLNGSPAVVIKPTANGNHTLPPSPQKAQSLRQREYTSPLPPNNGTQPDRTQSTQIPSSADSLYAQKAQPGPTTIGQSSEFQDSAKRFEQAEPEIPSPSAHASTKGYSGPYANSPVVSSYSIPRPSSSHVFSSPHSQSPSNLPPPGQPQMHTFRNGHSMQHHNKSAQTSESTSVYQSSPSIPPPHGLGSVSTPASNGQRTGPGDTGQRRSSINLPSPLNSALVLTPSNKINPPPNFPTTSDPVANSATQLRKSPSEHLASSPTLQQLPSHQAQDPAHASALPPSVTGLSPTKHSPPRPTTSNGSVGSATPSILPPVTSLSPSPRLQNLSPPVKPSEPEWNRPSGQSFSQ